LVSGASAQSAQIDSNVIDHLQLVIPGRREANADVGVL
jgi:hypothetical protein